MADQLEYLLQACAVHITSDVTERTGFFVAPDTVVTAGWHFDVLENATVYWPAGDQRARQVSFSGASTPVIDRGLLAREDTDSFGIVIFKVEGIEGHPCVAIDPKRPSERDRLLLVRYRPDLEVMIRGTAGIRDRRTRDAIPGLVAIASGTIPPEALGGPVLNLRSGGVCGVLVAGNDPTSLSGGLVYPLVYAFHSDLIAANKAFHEHDKRWTTAVVHRSAEEPASLDTIVDPDHITTRGEFSRALSALRLRAGLTVEQFATMSMISPSTASTYFSGRRLPGRSATIRDMLRTCGIYNEEQIEQWLTALARARALPSEHSPKRASSQDEDLADLLFRVYIPSGRLYAAEAGRLLSLFRDWLIASRGHGVRQTGYRTAVGEMYEFFTDASAVQPDLREEFDSFSRFLTLCAEDPGTAVEALAPMRLGRVSSTDLVARFGREVRRLQIDLRHERERRILSLRHSLEEELLDNGVDLQEISSNQLSVMLEHLVPGPSTPESLALLTGRETSQPTAPVTVYFTQQIISAMESTIIQNVQGTVQLGFQAKQLLELIGHFGGQEAAVLESAVYELEDAHARSAERSAAKRRLKRFLGQIAGSVHDVALELLEKYLESKVGL